MTTLCSATNFRISAPVDDPRTMNDQHTYSGAGNPPNSNPTPSASTQQSGQPVTTSPDQPIFITQTIEFTATKFQLTKIGGRDLESFTTSKGCQVVRWSALFTLPTAEYTHWFIKLLYFYGTNDVMNHVKVAGPPDKENLANSGHWHGFDEQRN
jgi:hypothetical protein